MATKTKRRPRVGDTAWHVDWCADLPWDPETESCDIDRADYRTEVYWSQAAAEKRAKAVLPKDAFGSVKVTPVELQAYDAADAIRYPHVGFWEPIGDSEYFEND